MNFVQGTLILGTLGLVYGPLAPYGMTGPQEEQHETQTPEMDLRDVAKSAKISLLDAMKAAAKAQDGTIVEAGLEGEITGKKREVFYEIMILDRADKLHEIKIDPASGAVTASGVEEDQEEVGEFKAAIRNGEIGLAQLIEKASSIIKGQPVSAGLEMEKEGPECEIVFANSRYLIEANLETRAGHLVDLELKKNGDDEREEHSHEEHEDKHDRSGGSKEKKDDDGDEGEEGEQEEEHEEGSRKR